MEKSKQTCLMIAGSFAVFLIFVAMSLSAEELVTIAPIQSMNVNEVSSISGTCHRDAKSPTMTCEFVQVGVHLAKTQEDFEKELEEVRNAYKSKETEKEIERACDEKSIKELEEMARTLKDKEMSDKYKKRLATFIGLQKKMCAKPSLKNFERFLKAFYEMESNTCKIWANPYRQTFTLGMDGKWVSNEGPQGICGVVVVSTLTHEEKHDNLWTYETRKVVTANKDSPLCQFEENPPIHSWKAPPKALNCEFIEFGF